MIVAADVGGTNTRVALFPDAGRNRPAWTRTEPTETVPLFRSWLAAQVRGFGNVRGVCVAVAGPVFDERSVTVNLPWSVDARELRAELGLEAVWVINDLEAAAYGLSTLGPEDCVELCAIRSGRAPAGNRAVIAAGTGLGEAGLFWDGHDYHPFATEGGHASFAPTDDLDVQLLRWLWQRFEHVSWERVLSGPGLKHVYDFLYELRGEQQPGPFENAEEIARAAQEGRCPVSAAAMERFARLYGAEAANLALKTMALGGVYVAGTMAVKNRAFLDSDSFREAFWGKGRMRPLLETVPVRLVLVEDLGLRGAAVCAQRRLQAQGSRTLRG